MLATTNTAKYLGVTLDTHLNWNAHIDNVHKKANNSLAFLRRNIHSCPKHIKKKCYEIYVRPILEYSSSVWDPYTHKNINKLETVQRRAARFVTGNYDQRSSVSSMLKDINWVPLEERRARNKVFLLRKAIDRNIDIPLEDLRKNNNVTRGAENAYNIPRSRTNTHLNSFFPSAIRLWNSVPTSLKNSSFANLKNKLPQIKLRVNCINDM